MNQQTGASGRHLKKLALAVGCTVAALHSTGSAAATIEEIIVTSQKTEENIQTTPIAITALTGELMDKKGITDMRGIIDASPSITTTPFPGAAVMPTVYMRGQGAILPMSITTDSPIGIYEDGFYIARPQSSVFDLADLERVEILRGPQGTLWGKNTTGGAINLISKEPSGEFNFSQKLTFGNEARFRSLTISICPEWAISRPRSPT
jgi:iron complex outermembrane receptor protein